MGQILMRNSFVSVVTDKNILERVEIMITIIFTAFMTIILLVLIAICFFDLGYITKELLLYVIKKSKKPDDQSELVRKIIDYYDKS